MSSDVEEVELETPGRVFGGGRRRRLIAFGGAAVAVSATVGALLLTADDPSPGARSTKQNALSGAPVESRDPPDRVTHQDTTVSVPSPDTQVAVQRIEIHTGLDGGEDIVFVFDGALPDAQVTYAPDINNLEGPGIGYAVQDPSKVLVCEAWHDFGPLGTGSIDVLIPSEWWRSDAPVQGAPIEWVPPLDSHGEHPNSPGKIAGCGPYDGHVQYSIWSPASDDADNVHVSVNDDLTRVVVRVRPARG